MRTQENQNRKHSVWNTETLLKLFLAVCLFTVLFAIGSYGAVCIAAAFVCAILFLFVKLSDILTDEHTKTAEEGATGKELHVGRGYQRNKVA